MVETALYVITPICHIGSAIVNPDGGKCFANSLAIVQIEIGGSKSNGVDWITGSMLENLTIGVASITTHPTPSDGSNFAIR